MYKSLITLSKSKIGLSKSKIGNAKNLKQLVYIYIYIYIYDTYNIAKITRQ